MSQSTDVHWVLLTGATGGIGESLTQKLRDSGFGVVAIGRSEEKLAQLSDTDPLIDARPHDLADPSATERLAQNIKDEHKIVGLINNAAIQNAVSLSSQTATEIDEEIRINLTAPAILASCFMQDLPQGRGFIVNVTSGLAVAPKSNAAVYCATKAGLRNLNAGIANQISPDKNIAVVDVVLPLVDTAMTAGRGSGKMTADAAASDIMAAIKRRKPVAWVGKAKLLAVIHRVAPSMAARIMRRG